MIDRWTVPLCLRPFVPLRLLLIPAEPTDSAPALRTRSLETPKTSLLFLASAAFFLLLLQGSIACAHIEKGYMPDALAIMEYRILLEFEPENHEVRNMLGMALYRQEKLDEAEQEFNAVLTLDPKNFDAIDALGLIKVQQGKLDHAKDLFTKAIFLNPEDMLVYYHLGQVQALLGDYHAAAVAYRTGLNRKPPVETTPSYNEQRQQLIEALKSLQEVSEL